VVTTDRELATPQTHIIVEMRSNSGLICHAIAQMLREQGWRVNVVIRKVDENTSAWLMNAYYKKGDLHG